MDSECLHRGAHLEFAHPAQRAVRLAHDLLRALQRVRAHVLRVAHGRGGLSELRGPGHLKKQRIKLGKLALAIVSLARTASLREW